MPGSPAWPDFVSRLERFPRLDSTQRVVREWLDDGVPEVCLAVADEQTAGRGRLDRRWLAPAGMALLVSGGFRPPDLSARHAWRLAALAALAMLEAAEEIVALPHGTLALKWPNDLVVRDGRRLRKLGGVLGEAVLEGHRVASAVVGLGINVDWPAAAFPPALAEGMTSLREVAGAGVDRDALLDAWLQRLERKRVVAAGGVFPARTWVDRQMTTGAQVEVHLDDRVVRGRGIGVDPEDGGLLLEAGPDDEALSVFVGDVVRCEVGEIERGL
ncbi:biotin--[acetyl-CoA-carboxylase] ligase [soil metagenome]